MPSQTHDPGHQPGPRCHESPLMRMLIMGDIMACIRDNGSVRLMWPDGTFVEGVARGGNRGAGAFSAELGMTISQMFTQHELMHAALEAWTGIPSQTMRALRGLPHDADATWPEEEAVKALQRYFHANGVDLLRLLESRQ